MPNNKEIEKRVNRISAKTFFDENLETYNFLKGRIHSAIPLLIESIDINDTVFQGEFPSHESNTHSLFNYNFVGIRFALMIENLLSEGNIAHDLKYYLIVREILGKPDLKRLTLDDMKNLKLIYKSWWEKNRNLTVEEIKEKWKREGSIIESNGYRWVNNSLKFMPFSNLERPLFIKRS